jgi:hypothetical protein
MANRRITGRGVAQFDTDARREVASARWMGFRTRKQAERNRRSAFAAALTAAALMLALPMTASAGSTTVLRGDFNADGFDDLAVGSPREDHGGVEDAGAVHVFYSQGGASLEGDVLSTANVQQFLGNGAFFRFGTALAAGDFNGDAVADLAVGAPGYQTNRGGVYVFYGRPSPARLGAGGQTVLAPDCCSRFRYGAALAAGDFGRAGNTPAGTDDLAIAGIGNVGSNAGRVVVAYGSGGSTFAGFYQELLSGTDASPVNGPLLAADLLPTPAGGATQDDLVVGGPFWDIGSKEDAGGALVFRGTQSSGLLAGTGTLLNQDRPGVAGTAEADDRFGRSLAAANFGDDGYADLAVGASNEDDGTRKDTGAVHVLYGGSEALAGASDQLFTQNSSSVIGGSQQGDRFGHALAAQNFGHSSRGDLAIGAPGKRSGARNGGAVHVLYSRRVGFETRLSASDNQRFTQNTAGIAGGAERNDFFGTSLGAGDYGLSSHGDLSVGVPLEDVGSATNGGAVHVLYGTSNGISSANDQLFSQNTGGVQGTAEDDDIFGATLTPP